MKVKVCGMRDAANTEAVAALGPEMMGFIFHERSPRHCGGMDPAVVRSLPESVMAVAVTVDRDEDYILELVSEYGFRAVQLHGDESPEMCRRLRDRGLTVLKAVPVSDAAGLLRAADYEDAADMLVLDTACAARGGSGKQFDWTLLSSPEAMSSIRTPFLLSGGIGPEDVDRIPDVTHPMLAGIDVNSRVERAPGIKNLELLQKLFAKL